VTVDVSEVAVTVSSDGSAVTLEVAQQGPQSDRAVTKNTQIDSYTLVLTDAFKSVEIDKGTSNTLTVPPNSSVAFPTGTTIEITQIGAGQITITPGSGVTFRGRGGAYKLAGQYGVAGIRKRDTNEWVVYGDVTT